MIELNDEIKDELAQFIYEHEIEIVAHIAELMTETGANQYNAKGLMESWLDGKSIEDIKECLKLT